MTVPKPTLPAYSPGHVTGYTVSAADYDNDVLQQGARTQLLSEPVTSFPASPALNDYCFRSDKSCWYLCTNATGPVWSVVGIEQGGNVNASPVQTVSTVSGTFTDITGASVSVTTLGAGTIEMTGFVRCDSATAQYYARSLINGSDPLGGAYPVGDNTSGTFDLPLSARLAVAAAGTYVAKAQVAMVSAGSVRVVSACFIWRVTK